MKLYDIAFYASGFFLIGALLNSFKLNAYLIALVTAFVAVLFLLVGYIKTGSGFKSQALSRGQNFQNRAFWLAGLSPIIFLGALYAALFNYYQIKQVHIVFDKKINFSGVVVDYPQYGNVQNLKLTLQSPYSGNILVKLPPRPEFHYGDLIKLEAVIKRPAPANYADYLKKERIFGVVNAFNAGFVSMGNGQIWRAKLFSLKEGVITNFQKVLPAEKSAFLTGLMLGERSEFSPELKEAMKNSGTTHLTALSGYNISIIASTVGILLSWFLSRRWSFLLSIIVIIGFVLMTGAEASVVRAAIMGVILLLANQIGRIFSLRNAIIIAAFLMVLANPRILRFDTGFQLSFLALLGIAYVSPALRKLFKMKEGGDFLSIKNNFLQTFGAQMAVVPFLILYFGKFSLVSLLANVLILAFIPLTMAIGFIVGAIGFASWSLSLISGWSLYPLLAYELSIIRILGSLNILRVDSISIASAVAYYLVLVGFVVYMNLKTQPAEKKL